MEKIRRFRKPIIGTVMASIFVLVVFIPLIPVLYKSDVRYTRGIYKVSKDRAVTSCVVRNHGRSSAERTRMSVEFLSKILDIWFSPEPAGKVVGIAPDQLTAVLELGNIAPKGEVTIFFAVEQPQHKPFGINMLDVSGAAHPRERTTPIR